MLVRYVTVVALILVSPLALAEGRKNDSAGSRRIERMEDRIEAQKKDLAEKKKELARLNKELAQRRIGKKSAAGKAGMPSPSAGTEREIGDEAEEVKSEIADLKEEIERNEEKLDRLEASAEKGPEACESCQARRAAPNQGKSGWESFADVLKAATPLGLGGMNAWLGNQGLKAQSSDYQLYNSTNTALGLPSQAPAGYGNLLANFSGNNGMLAMASMGGNSGFGMNMFMPGMYGSSYGYGMPSYGLGYSPTSYAYSGVGGAYMSPAVAYGTNAFGSMGMSYYNPYGSAYYGQYNGSGLNSFYQNQLMNSQAGIYSARQQTLLGQDAQVAQQSLSEAYSRYNYVMQQMGGTTSGYLGSANTAVPSLSVTRQ
jgi:hypothetical protein